VRQRPCGAKPRNLLPLGPHPRNGAMLVRIQVSSMKTSRFGSKRFCQVFQRALRRAMSTRPCSRANSVFFKAQALAAHELPDGIVGDAHAAGGQLILQPM